MLLLKLDLSKFQGHLSPLDGLRGIAILLVLAYHLFRFINIFSVGWVGVDLFFVLSGYLITGILLDTVHHERYWKNFFFRRVLRIFPLYYFSILLFILLSIFSIPFSTNQYVNYGYFNQNQFWFWSYLTNWKMFLDNEWLPVIVFNTFWSLSIEEQFYILWPLFVKKYFRILPKAIMVLLCVILIGRIVALNYSYLSEVVIYTLTIFRIDTILTGALIALLIRLKSARLLLERFYLYILGVSLFVLVAVLAIEGSFHAFDRYVQMFGYTFIAVAFAMLLLLALNSNNTFKLYRKILENPILVFFGKYSYSIYIFHWAFYLFFRDHLNRFFSSYIGNEFIVKIISSIMILFITILFSQFTWHGLEKHFLKLKKYFSYK